MVPRRVVRWRRGNEHDHRADLDYLHSPVGAGHVRFDKPRFGVARCGKQDPRSEGQTRETREKSEKGRGEAFEELSSTGEEVSSNRRSTEECSICFPVPLDEVPRQLHIALALHQNGLEAALTPTKCCHRNLDFKEE